MAHTNSTPNYNLPQFLGSDKPAWLTDINQAMSDIDTAIAAAKTVADSASTSVSALGVTVGNHTTQLSTLSGAVTSQGNTLNTVTALIGNGVPTTTDQTIIGAINELAAIVEPDSVEVTADGVKTYGDLLGEIRGAMDFTKVSYRSFVDMISTNGTHTPFRNTTNSTSLVTFDNTTDGGSGKVGNFHVILTSGNDKYNYQDGSTDTVLTNNAAPAGMKIKLIY